MVEAGSSRWVEVSESVFEHEREGLDLIRQVLSDESPYRAWTNAEFRDARGGWHEVDLILLTRKTLYVVELKHYMGTISGNDNTWMRSSGRAESSPLRLARRKAQYLASRLQDECRAFLAEHGSQIPVKDVVPFVSQAVFLHHPKFRVDLPSASTKGLYGPDGAEHETHLVGISELLLEDGGATPMTADREFFITQLMDRLGLVQRREREVGMWRIEDAAMAEGADWQDWLAYHRLVNDKEARIRFRLLDQMASAEAVKETEKLAQNEFKVTRKLTHEGILRPDELVECELGIGLLYPYHRDDERLDHWRESGTTNSTLAQQLMVVRQVAESLHYAHRNHVVHRALNPTAVWLREREGKLRAQVGGWEAAGVASSEHGTQMSGVTALHHDDFATLGDGTTTKSTVAFDPSRALEEAFVAPEGAWSKNADRIRLDVFSLGALTHYLLTGRPAASSATALKTRLNREGGLDLAVDLPQVSSELRDLVLRATDPLPTRRLPDVGAFLAVLAKAERSSLEAEPEADPLSAVPGTRLDDRFTLEARLGQGSTAAGLAVRDEVDGAERVLKVALNETAATRLADEAEVLKKLTSPRIVRLVEGPITVGGRQALLLENAGRRTLSEEIRAGQRLPLDRLERYGTDLLDAVVTLDKAGIDHRDIKPSNLGVQLSRGERKEHLVLFDFSLTGVPATSTRSGTPPYLDPFFIGDRTTYDSAAERYSAAVVLFEMATGSTPIYGDGSAEPSVIDDDVTLETSMFDPHLAGEFVAFFRQGLHRDATKRFSTAEAMRAAWKAVFAHVASDEESEAENDKRAAVATLSTPITDAGLSIHALSALEPLGLHTVGEFLAAFEGRPVHEYPAMGFATRLHIQRRRTEWRARLGGAPVARSLTDAAETLRQALSTDEADAQGRAVLRVVLGVSGNATAFASFSDIAARLDGAVSPARVASSLAELQKKWAADENTEALLSQLVGIVRERLVECGGVATPEELAAALMGEFDAEGDTRRALGLLRLTVECDRFRGRVTGDEQVLEIRRHDSTVTLIAVDPRLFDVAEQLGAIADSLVDELGDPTTELVHASRVNARLAPLRNSEDWPQELRDLQRLASLGAALSRTARATATGELHAETYSQAAALAVTLAGFGGLQRLTEAEVSSRVEARFPQMSPLPRRPRLDALIDEAELPLVYDEKDRAYRAQNLDRHTTGLETRRPTVHEFTSEPLAVGGRFGVRLADSVRSRSFVALGVRSDRLTESVAALTGQFGAEVVDFSGLLVDELKGMLGSGKLTWESVRAADAAAAHTRPAQGLEAMVSRALPAIEQKLAAQLADASATGPLLITDASPLARYDRMDVLSRWTDLAAKRDRAVWLLVPQLGGNHGALLDGAPVPLAAPSQFVLLDSDWIDTTAAAAGAAKE